MAEPSEIEKLAERKRKLIAESDRHRQDISRELRNLGTVATWAERGYSAAQSVRAWWPIAGVVAGFLITKKGGSLFRGLAKGWSWWQIAKRFAPIWRRAYEAFSAKERD